MYRHTLVLLLSLLPASLPGGAVHAERALEVTYVANEGFLIEAGGEKILIDALFHADRINWCHVPTQEVLEKMTGATPPFDEVDLVLITHAHVDHFDPELVLEHMSSNPKVVVAGPPQAIRRLRAHETWDDKFEAGVRELDLPLHGRRELSVGGIRVTAHRVRRSPYMEKDPETGGERNRHADVENIAYLFEMGGVTALHLGDASLSSDPEYFAGEAFRGTDIDVLFMGGFDDASVRMARDQLKAGQVIPMHLRPEPQRYERVPGEVLPSTVILRTPMETRRFVLPWADGP